MVDDWRRGGHGASIYSVDATPFHRWVSEFHDIAT